MDILSSPRLFLEGSAKDICDLSSVLQHGITCPCDKTLLLLDFLLGQPGFSADYIEKTVQTIFVNGVAADRLDIELQGGDTVALSAAMPGLAGAIFRRQGIHASLRSRPQGRSEGKESQAGAITLKLFNSIATDRIIDLLQTGIYIDGKAFREFAQSREYLFTERVTASIDGQKIAFLEMLDRCGASPFLGLQAIILPEKE